ncbi:MAG: M23 family metallopeptidase [Treponema sp.]|nr:M23 family metallopeptidase [Treponema sp.]
MTRRGLLSFILFAGLLELAWPVENPQGGYPAIGRLDMGDTIFKQYIADVETARRRLFASARDQVAGEDLTIYAYTPQKGEDLFSLAARCNIPYAALATLNRLPNPVFPEDAGTLLLPSVPGLFIPENADSELERLLSSSRNGETALMVTLSRNGARERFRFIPGADFSPTERAFFLHREFRFPLKSYRLTSAYGPRLSPITGTPRFHGGLDLAAPEGTEVYAVRDGVVSDAGEDPVYGRYIIISHGDNWASLYGHLSYTAADLRSSVQSGSLIGKVGSTGLSTGPHLHFELRQNGKTRDPGKYLFKEGSRQ